MPLCIICDAKFYPQTRDAEAETCDCGTELTKAEALANPELHSDAIKSFEALIRAETDAAFAK